MISLFHYILSLTRSSSSYPPHISFTMNEIITLRVHLARHSPEQLQKQAFSAVSGHPSGTFSQVQPRTVAETSRFVSAVSGHPSGTFSQTQSRTVAETSRFRRFRSPFGHITDKSRPNDAPEKKNGTRHTAWPHSFVSVKVIRPLIVSGITL